MLAIERAVRPLLSSLLFISAIALAAPSPGPAVTAALGHSTHLRQVREIERGLLISEEILRHLVTVLEDRGPADEIAPAVAPRASADAEGTDTSDAAHEAEEGVATEPSAPAAEAADEPAMETEPEPEPEPEPELVAANGRLLRRDTQQRQWIDSLSPGIPGSVGALSHHCRRPSSVIRGPAATRHALAGGRSHRTVSKRRWRPPNRITRGSE